MADAAAQRALALEGDEARSLGSERLREVLCPHGQRSPVVQAVTDRGVGEFEQAAAGFGVEARG